MEWRICFGLSLLVLIVTLISAYILLKIKYKSQRIWNSFNVLMGGVFISSFILYFPAYYHDFEKESFRIFKTFLITFYNTLRAFVLEGDFGFLKECVGQSNSGVETACTMLGVVLLVLAPALTFGVVLSFFKNVFSYFDYWGRFFSDVYVFSELNEQSLALATSLKENDNRRVVVFMEVFKKNEEVRYELTERARELGVITFKRDITDINFSIHSKRKPITFFTMSENDVENVNQAIRLIKKYKDRENTAVYVFATKTESELMLSSVETGQIKVRRINKIRSLTSRHLYEEGIKIFENAVTRNDNEKMISAVVLGMGEHGFEMARTLPWFCQMDGYRAYINLFDKRSDAKSRFSAECPELMDENHNKKFESKGEARYSIDIHDEIDVETNEFWEVLKTLPQVTYVYVALGNDEMNIRTAVKLRSWFKREGIHPQIDALVQDTEKKKALQGVTNYSNQEYHINFIGDIESTCSEKVILHSDVEEVALSRHLKWGEEEAFWKYEYNYRSSVASAIHRKMKSLCGIPGADKLPNEREEEERQGLRILEHRRWNAYMRSEGYVYAEKKDSLAKTHPCLVEFEELSLKEQQKDDD